MSSERPDNQEGVLDEIKEKDPNMLSLNEGDILTKIARYNLIRKIRGSLGHMTGIGPQAFFAVVHYYKTAFLKKLD